MVIRLKNDSDELLWEQVYQGTIISNGSLILEGVNGNDKCGCFDQPGVWLEFKLTEILGLNIVTEPYAIKSELVTPVETRCDCWMFPFEIVMSWIAMY